MVFWEKPLIILCLRLCSYPGLRIFIPERAQLNSGILQGQRRIPIFTDGSKLAEDTDARVFCRELDTKLHFRLSGDCSVFR